MWDSIQRMIAEGDYQAARAEVNIALNAGGYDETLSILDASICEYEADYKRMFEVIGHGLRINICNYELYYLLGNYCLNAENNVNQAYLCYENALYYCNTEEDREFLTQVCDGLKNNYKVDVKPVAIIIVSYNGCYLMQKNIESIRGTLPEGSYRIIVVDNASTDGVTEWLGEQEDITLVVNAENRGFPVACNQGAGLVDTESHDIFLLNNDTRLALNSLFFLRMGLYNTDKAGATGALSNYAGNNQELNVEFQLPGEYLEYAKGINIPISESYEERVRLSGFAMLIRGNVWSLTGGMDEDFTPGYFEDDALSMQIMMRGYHLFLCRNSFIYHAGSQSFAQDAKVNNYLIEHHELFIKKYGFDILEHCYANEEYINRLEHSRDKEFNVLEIGCGLGANIKAIKGLYPKAHCVGLETNTALYNVASKCEIVFDSVDRMSEIFKAPVFNVLIINSEEFAELSSEEKDAIAGMCAAGVKLIPYKDKYEHFPFKDIKLVVWDMDDTFWNGTLSEGDIHIPDENVRLVKTLAQNGIISSISSKNDEDDVLAKLDEAGVREYFVFNNINWSDKGQQLNDKLEDMKLRPANVLFIDDNVHNLENARYYCEGIMTALPDVTGSLAKYADGLNKSDMELKRLKSYRLLEKKSAAKRETSDSLQFLRESNIVVTINRNCLEELDRIEELVLRSNQLNYTKNRDSKELLEKLITNDWNDCACIRVCDRFGDYGIAGFYCYNTRENVMEHFLFSCRIMGMGVEQYIYNRLGCPKFSIKEPVAVELKDNSMVDWITEDDSSCITEDALVDKKVRILLKGPCDLSAIEGYLRGGSITTEFNYVNNEGFVTTGQNHSMHIWQSAHMPENELNAIIENVPFIIQGDFKTKIFCEKYNIICYSLLQDCNAGLYRNKTSGSYIAFSHRNIDITDENNWERILNDETLSLHDFNFTREILSSFSKEWEFAGRTTNEQLLRNLEYICDNVKGKPLIVLLLGSEKEYGGNISEEYRGLCDVYREINPLVKKFAENRPDIKLIEITNYINSSEDFSDCINHFSRDVYYRIADDLVKYINESH